MEVLKFILDMEYKEENQVSKKDSLQQVINSTPEHSKAHQSAKAQLEEEPELPFCTSHIWEWFWDLSNRRQTGMEGPSLLTYSEIQAWSNLKRIGISDIELDILEQIDNAYMDFISEKQKKKRNK